MMIDSSPLLEICVDCVESIENAIKGGADRLELCSALSEGGLTPTFGLAKLAKQISPIPVFAMIRIRSGDFIYRPQEIDAMMTDLELLKSIGIDGFVFGALTSSNNLDVAACRRAVELAQPLPVTFHRAFDVLPEPLAAFDQIRELGFARILTSGQQRAAEDGAELIARLVERGGNDLIVMPGAGITEKNIGSLMERTRAREFHGSAKKMENVGNAVTVTDDETVTLMAGIIKGRL